MSCKTFLAVGIVGLGLALSSSAHAITVNPAGEKFKFGWEDGNGDIDGICRGTCEFADLGDDKVWSIKATKNSILSVLKVTDGYVPGDKFSLKINGEPTAWSSERLIEKAHERTGTIRNDYFEGSLTNFLLEAGKMYNFVLSVTVTSSLCTRDGQVLDPCKVGAAFAEFGPLEDADAPPDEAPTAVPVPAALPLLATGLGILGFGAWRRRR
jgi:hypothetical protein